MADRDVPGAPPGGSAGPPGPGRKPYTLWILVAVIVAFVIILGLALLNNVIGA